MVTPLFVEIIGEPEVGKTHLSCTFPSPLLLDTTPKAEAMPIIRKLHEDWRNRYVRVRSWKDVVAVLERLKEDKEKKFKTVVVDTSADLQNLAAAEWLEEVNKERRKAGKDELKAVFPITEYRWVRAKVDDFICEVVDPDRLGRNLVFIAQMKDEWVGGKSTGRRCRDGYKKAPFYADIRLYMFLEAVTDEKGLATGRYVRKCRVVKNRFIDKCSEEWVEYINPSWEEIVKITGLSPEEVVC